MQGLERIRHFDFTSRADTVVVSARTHTHIYTHKHTHRDLEELITDPKSSLKDEFNDTVDQCKHFFTLKSLDEISYVAKQLSANVTELDPHIEYVAYSLKESLNRF